MINHLLFNVENIISIIHFMGHLNPPPTTVINVDWFSCHAYTKCVMCKYFWLWLIALLLTTQLKYNFLLKYLSIVSLWHRCGPFTLIAEYHTNRHCSFLYECLIVALHFELTLHVAIRFQQRTRLLEYINIQDNHRKVLPYKHASMHIEMLFNRFLGLYKGYFSHEWQDRIK